MQGAGEIAEIAEFGQGGLSNASGLGTLGASERSRDEIRSVPVLSISLLCSPFTPFSETVICARVLTKRVGRFVKILEQFFGRVAVTAVTCGQIQSGSIQRSAFGGLFRVC
jgi:hypothetical protein